MRAKTKKEAATRDAREESRGHRDDGGGSGAHAHTRTSWSSRSKASHVVWAPKRSPVGRTCASSTNDSDAVWNRARLSKHPLSVVQHERSTTLLV